jgi:hypothetical protein
MSRIMHVIATFDKQRVHEDTIDQLIEVTVGTLILRIIRRATAVDEDDVEGDEILHEGNADPHDSSHIRTEFIS